MHKTVKQYLRQVSRWLPCSSTAKKQILDSIHCSIDHYLAENPSPALSDLTHRFGSPQQIAASYVSEMDTARLLHDLRIRRRVLTSVVTGILAFLILWFGVVYAAWLDARNSNAGEITDKIEYIQ